MRAVDTNLVVRFLAADDLGQFARARAVFEAGDVVVPLTVVLEAEWVMRRLLRYPPDRVLMALRSITNLPGVSVEHVGRVARALDWAEAGMDLADALHLASAPEGATFLTFDRDLVRAARRLGLDAREP